MGIEYNHDLFVHHKTYRLYAMPPRAQVINVGLFVLQNSGLVGGAANENQIQNS